MSRVAQGLIEHFHQRLPEWLRSSLVPGAGLALVEDATLVWRGAFGIRDAEAGTAVENRTTFEAASMSKPAFAYVVMKLCERGLLHLDTPLVHYAPGRLLDGDPRLDQMTARHVLSHTGGFQNWRSEEKPLAIHFTPGERYLYSGEGYNYLQTVITHLLGRPFESYMHERLFRPMGMTSSGYVWNGMFAARMARPHDAQGRAMANQKSTPRDVARYGAAGALLTTPADFARFLIATVAPGPSDRFRLAPSWVAEMVRPHVKIDGGRYPASWALGWQIFHNNGRDFIYHGGDNKGFHCFAVASVAGRSGLVVMTNGESGPAVLQNVIQDELTQSFLIGTAK